MHEFKPTLERRLDDIREPFAAFIPAQATASGFLLFALLAALWVANSSTSRPSGSIDAVAGKSAT